MLHRYSDRCEVAIPTYALEEVLAEKLRALLTRRRARHFYDVWYLLKYHADLMQRGTVLRVFAEKCQYKQVPFEGPPDFFRPEALAVYAASWTKSLVHQLSNPPGFAAVSVECRQLVEALFGEKDR
ncbi:MAG: nucleotidyl transferase AbiEii/AbiGii toxin family protein [Chloroflexi bacterium]|nr:nucleotidyl transferase AbiEii/AbiGii toxin family protein [Chloroflexota bacterium]